MAILNQIHNGELDANLVLLGDPSPDDDTSENGIRLIHQYIGKLGLAVSTVGLGNRTMREIGVTVTRELSKVGLQGSNLVDLINALPEPEPR